MLGTIVNALAVVAGSLLGLIFRGGIPDKYNRTIMHAISLAVILIGMMSALKVQNLLLVIMSMVIGSILGEYWKIEDRLTNLGNLLESRFAKYGNGISKGFVTASLVFCVGSMAIVGSLESGLTGNHQTLFAKSILDGISSIVFASSMGIGVMFSAAAIFLYQGFITVTAVFMKQFLIDAVITEMTAVGGLLIVALGFNMLEMSKIKVANMLPAIFIPLVYFMIHIGLGHFGIRW